MIVDQAPLGVGTLALLVVAGVGAGITGSTAGLASLVSYPALLAVGLPPVTANVTNTVALIGSSIGSVSGSLVELRGQGRDTRRYAGIAVVAGATGATLLLLGPAGTFEGLVPYLIASASALLLLSPRLRAIRTGRPGAAEPLTSAPESGPGPGSGSELPGVGAQGSLGSGPDGSGSAVPGSLGSAPDGSGSAVPGSAVPGSAVPGSAVPGSAVPGSPVHRSALVPVGLFVTCVYGGYFGAAAGVMILALLLFATDKALPAANALKNLLLGIANAVAAAGFLVFADVRLVAAVPLGLGCVVGGRIGPAIVRRVPPTLMRTVIAVAGFGLSIKLWWG